MSSTSPWTRDSIIGILIASLPVSAYLLFVSCKNLYHYINKIKPTKDGSWARIVTAVAQVLGSVGHFINQVMFLVQLTVPASRLPIGGCFTWIWVADIAYLIFQPCATLVLIRRATSVVPQRSHHALYRRDFVQAFFTLWFFAGFIPVFISVALRDIWTNMDTDTCGAMYVLHLNAGGKMVFFALYMALVLCFSFPLIKHIRSMSKLSSTSRLRSTSGQQTGGQSSNGGSSSLNGASTMNTATRSANVTKTTTTGEHDRASTDTILKQLLKDVTFRIMLAVVAYLCTATAALLGGFAGAFQCQFTFENCAALYAATLSGKSNKASGSTASSQASLTKCEARPQVVRSTSQMSRGQTVKATAKQ